MNYKNAIQQQTHQHENSIPKGVVLLKKGQIIETHEPYVPSKKILTQPVSKELTFDDLREDSIKITLAEKIENICKHFHEETLLYDNSLSFVTDNIFPDVWLILEPAINIKVKDLETESDTDNETEDVYDDIWVQ